MNWKKLQNGSDIRGVALEGIEGENVNFTPEVVETIAKAFVKWISNTTGNQHPTIAIGAPIPTTSLIIGFVAAFISGCFACKWMIALVKKCKLYYFAIYCAIVGIIALCC